MEEVVILGADGRPVKGMQLDREMIHLGDADGAYMDCSRESVTELSEERNERLKRQYCKRIPKCGEIYLPVCFRLNWRALRIHTTKSIIYY